MQQENMFNFNAHFQAPLCVFPLVEKSVTE